MDMYKCLLNSKLLVQVLHDAFGGMLNLERELLNKLSLLA